MSDNIEKTDIIISKEEKQVNSENKETKSEVLQPNEDSKGQNIEIKVEVNTEKIEQKENNDKNENKSKKENDEEEEEEEEEEEKEEKEKEKREEKKEKEKESDIMGVGVEEEKKEEIKIEENKNDKIDNKIEETKEEKNEVKEESKKEEDDEIKIIKKKKTLIQSDSDLLKEKEQQKENIKENINEPKKENIPETESKPLEEKKLPTKIISSRTRYSFPSDNKNLVNIENPQKSIINSKNNHQIFISIVPISSKKENKYPIQNTNQPKQIYNNIQKENNPKIEYNKNIQRKIKPPILEVCKPIVLNNNNININKSNEKNTSQRIKNNTIIDISKQRNKNLNENKPQNQTALKNNNNQIISNKRIISSPLPQNIKSNNTKFENKYIKSPQNPKESKEQINKENITKMISTNTTNRRITSNYLTNPNQQRIKNEIKKFENKYVTKKIEPPSTETKDKTNKKIYTSIKIDLSKYNTEKKPANTKSKFLNYNSRTVDTRKKEPTKLKYYDRCPNCGYHLNE